MGCKILKYLKSPAAAELGNALQMVLAFEGAEPAESTRIGAEAGGGLGFSIAPIAKDSLGIPGGLDQRIGQLNRIGRADGLSVRAKSFAVRSACDNGNQIFPVAAGFESFVGDADLPALVLLEQV